MTLPISLQEQLHAYLQLVEALFAGRLSESELAAAVRQLPPLSRELLDTLAGRCEAAGLEQPRRGWAIATVAEAAAHLRPEAPLLQALAAWHLGRAANEWLRPNAVEQAIRRARAGFALLNEKGWVTTCDWQLNAIPWTRPNYPQAAAKLSQALQGLEQAGMSRFIPRCRLSLAYAQLLAGDYTEALSNIQASEQVFLAADPGNAGVNVARCRLAMSSCLRRLSRYEEALIYPQQALADFVHSPIDTAKAHYQLAYIQLRAHDDYAAAEATFQAAATTFQERDLSLWFALCQTGLAEVYSNSGRIADAGRCLSQAHDICTRWNAVGPLADSLIDNDVLAKVRGELPLSLNHFQRAQQLYEQLGTARMAAIAALFVGDTNRQLGRYQAALHHLERAQAHLQVMDDPERLAECELRLAEVWAKLGRFDLAHSHLDAAAGYYQRTGQPAFLASVYNLRAELWFNQNQVAQALASLEAALMVNQQAGSSLPDALSRRLLGEALAAAGRYEEAIAYLHSAAAQVDQIGFKIEQAACQAALGRCYAQLAQREAAQDAWGQALRLSQELMPDITWQARAGLAQLAETAADYPAALQQYRLAVQALGQLRQGFWQPALAGSYLHHPAPVFNQAVRLAVSVGAAADALTFIEGGKAQTTLRQLEMGGKAIQAKTTPAAPGWDRLPELTREIAWLQAYLRLNRHPGHAGATIQGSHLAEERQLRQQLQARVADYDTLKSRLERAHLAGRNEERPARLYFDLPSFRQLAQAALGENWTAVDYYLADDATIHGVLVTAAGCQSWRTAASSRVQLALGICARTSYGGQQLTERDRAVLGRWLLPDSVRACLRPTTHLIIAPHRQLHRLPWPALLLDEDGTPLVAACMPSLVPSFHSLVLLWQRRPPDSSQNGLILAAADFGGRYAPLPAVVTESRQLVALTGGHSVQLAGEAATWDHLLAQVQENGLASFAFWHIASHAFHDPATGRLSGIALADRDIWLDDWWQLAPLPSLVTLSACSGVQSRLHEGDEHVGLATTCLAAGAQSVVGSLWPVRDQAAADLMPTFYTHFLAGHRPASALALAQRAAIADGRSHAHWGNFLCTGAP